jgi:predicted small secreted protein
VRVRQLAVAAVAIAVASAGLTACNTKVGAAAIVGSDRISDNSVQRYVQPGAKPYSGSAQDASGQTQTVTVVPKVNALQDLIYVALFEQGLAAHGGPATQAELNAQAPSAQAIAQERSLDVSEGYTSRFVDLEVQAIELQGVLAKRVNDPGDGSLLTKAITGHVDVSPRYGEWNTSAHTISSGASDGLPSFVKLTGASATPAAG